MSEPVLEKSRLYLREMQTDKQSIKQLFSYIQRDFGFLGHTPFFVMHPALTKKKLSAVYLSDGHTNFGYAVYQRVAESEWIHVLYLAILPQFRSSGLGGVLLDQLNLLSNGNTLLEVDDPAGSLGKKSREVCRRRIAFYERNGFQLYQEAKLKHFIYPLFMMTSRVIPKQEHQKIRRLYQNLYNDLYGYPIGSIMVRAKKAVCNG